jgi:hypothetical protein
MRRPVSLALSWVTAAIELGLLFDLAAVLTAGQRGGVCLRGYQGLVGGQFFRTERVLGWRHFSFYQSFGVVESQLFMGSARERHRRQRRTRGLTSSLKCIALLSVSHNGLIMREGCGKRDHTD